MLSHELYDLGHLYEAAVAHYQATGKRTLLDIALRTANLLCDTFGPRKQAIWPGHQIVEMGLVKLYRVTGDERYLNLAKFMLDVRGGKNGSQYNQSHEPVVDQTEAVGHAVRATYMYSGMADVAAMTGDTRYIHAIDAIWENVVGKKLYITGGIGATGASEAFGANSDRLQRNLRVGWQRFLEPTSVPAARRREIRRRPGADSLQRPDLGRVTRR